LTTRHGTVAKGVEVFKVRAFVQNTDARDDAIDIV
jgi:hypothetical protein